MPDKNKPMNSPKITTADTHLIDLRRVVKNYKTPAGDFPALKGIDLQVGRGEFVAVYGKSGAGKSTMINLITGIDNPTSGEIVIDNTALHKLNEDQRSRWRGRNLGIVFQFFQLLPSLTLIENITLAMDFCNTYPLRERKARALQTARSGGHRPARLQNPVAHFRRAAAARGHRARAGERSAGDCGR